MSFGILLYHDFIFKQKMFPWTYEHMKSKNYKNVQICPYYENMDKTL